MKNQNPPPPTHWPLAIMPQIGSLKVYSMVPFGQYEFTKPVDNFWWSDYRFPEGIGPFGSLWECMENFRDSTMAPAEAKDNVIHVDFVTKRRKS